MFSVDLVLFDMDGVLADTEPLHLAATNRVLEAEGVHIAEDECRAFLGNTDEAYFRALKRRYALASPVEHYVDRKACEVLSCVRELVPNPGVCELLLRLRMNGVKTCVASSSAPMLIDAVVDALGLRRSFDGLFSASMVPRGKPSPDLFYHASRQLGVGPAACLVIEDAPAGIEAARRAGMRVVAVRTDMTEGLDLSPANHVIDSLLDFEDRFLHDA